MCSYAAETANPGPWVSLGDGGGVPVEAVHGRKSVCVCVCVPGLSSVVCLLPACVLACLLSRQARVLGAPVAASVIKDCGMIAFWRKRSQKREHLANIRQKRQPFRDLTNVCPKVRTLLIFFGKPCPKVRTLCELSPKV